MITIYPDLPYDHAGGDGGIRSTTQVVVIHATDNTASDEAEAHYAETRPDHTSAHFYADDDSVIQALPTDHIAWGCFPIGNGRSIQFELTGKDWPDPAQVTDATMRQAARIVARVCRDWGIPVVKVGPGQLRAGARGICGHADVTLAWGEGDHMDPGAAFPWDRFIGYVQQGGDVDELTRVATMADHWGSALAQDLDTVDILFPDGTKKTVPNVAKRRREELKAALDEVKTTLTALGTPTLTDAQVAALGAQVGAHLDARVEALTKLLAQAVGAGAVAAANVLDPPQA